MSKNFLSRPISRRDFGIVAGTGLLSLIASCVPGSGNVPYYFYQNQNPIPTPRPTPRPVTGNSSIESCFENISEQRIRQIGRQGGYLNPGPTSYMMYNGDEVSYLCYNITGQETCRNRILTIEDMEAQLSDAIGSDLQNSCSLSGNPSVDVTIREDETLVTARNGSLELFNSFPFPLGRLWRVAHDIKNREATTGDFDTLAYALEQTQITNKPYMIQRLQPYPDKLYICKIKDVPPGDDFIFQFAIEGEPR